MPPYTAPTSSGSRVELLLDLGISRRKALGLVGLGATSSWFAPAQAADEARPDDLVIGNPNAKCTVIEYASLDCPHCAHFAEEMFPKFRADYVDTGKIRYIYRDFPLHQPAMWAAQVARCSGPMRRMGYISLYFQTQSNWLADANDPDKLLNDVAKVARTGGMSREQFDACLKDKTVEDQILQSRIEAVNKYNIDATPSFVINGKSYNAVATYDEFKRLIDKACGF